MILCVGLTPAWQRTLEFDRLRAGHVNRAARVTESPAGKSINVARVLRTLGANVVATGILGGDTGHAIARALSRAGIRACFVTGHSPTRICETVMDHATGTITELVQEAAPISPVEWRAFFVRFKRLAASARLVVISGKLPPGTPSDTYAKLARCGAPVIIDSQGPPMLRAARAGVLLAKLNEEELAATPGLLAANAENIVVTAGKDGARLINRAGQWRYRPPRIRVINPIGSGDAMTAGIAHALARGASPVEAVRLGVACGAANALTLTPGTVTRAAVRRLQRGGTCRPEKGTNE
jgi:tagatose 6-phosphate kinase